MASPVHIPEKSGTSAYPATEGEHIVQMGDTLYAIAVRYGLTFSELAEKNGLSAPYIIHPGDSLQVGSLPLGSSNPQPIASVNRPTGAITRAVETESKITTKKVTEEPIKKTVVSTSHQPSTVVESAPNKKRTVSNSSSDKSVNKNGSWQWPVSGRLISHFSEGSGPYKGIAIGGNIGESVVATAAGKVVYSGAGLAGYGNLIIIRHNSRYLSAYAHNRSLLVGEGEQVKAGQQIAELGSTGTNEPKLHFEIRQNGKPVDPLLFLPNR